MQKRGSDDTFLRVFLLYVVARYKFFFCIHVFFGNLLFLFPQNSGTLTKIREKAHIFFWKYRNVRQGFFLLVSPVS